MLSSCRIGLYTESAVIKKIHYLIDTLLIDIFVKGSFKKDYSEIYMKLFSALISCLINHLASKLK